MTETDNSEQLPQPGAPNGGPRRRRWRGALTGALLLGVGAIGGFAAGSLHGGPWWILSAAAHQGFNPERMGRHLDHRVDRVLERVDATPEQRDKVTGIFKSTLNDLSNLGIKPGDTREKVVELLRADTIDPNAFEALRAEQVGKVDAASKQLVQAVTEAAQVLTPEQRRELADRWDDHGWFSHRHHDR